MSPATSLGETPLIENKSRHGHVTYRPKPTSKRIVASKEKMQRDFLFDAVLGPNASQEEVYEKSVGDAVSDNIFRGYNTTILAYGQSGSGKTFTMFGQREAEKMAPSPDGSSFAQSFKFDKSRGSGDSVSAEEGIIPRAIHDLFTSKQREEKAGKVSILLTFMEIYNDELRDLMVDGGSDMKIRDSGDDGFFVEGLTSIVVKSAAHARDLMDTASTRRRTASTKLNMRSSRSHAICTLTVSTETVSAKLTMVDLAGSERIKQSGVSKMAQKESININKDLFVLAKVISALADKSSLKKNTHVPYRDSKLTSLLRDSLGGKQRLVNCMFINLRLMSLT
jgi:Kinesin motor domain